MHKYIKGNSYLNIEKVNVAMSNGNLTFSIDITIKVDIGMKLEDYTNTKLIG